MSAERAVALRSRSSSIGGGTRVPVWPGLPPPPRACRGPPARTGCSWRSGTGRARGQVGGRGLLLGQSDGRDPQAPEACLEAAGRGWRPPTPSGRGCRELLQSACASVGCAASSGSAGSASPCSEAARWRLRVSGVCCVGSADNRGLPGPPGPVSSGGTEFCESCALPPLWPSAGNPHRAAGAAWTGGCSTAERRGLLWASSASSGSTALTAVTSLARGSVPLRPSQNQPVRMQWSVVKS